MGWNQGMTMLEKTIVDLYEINKLDKEVVKVILGPYKNTDIDSGGLMFIETKNGLNVIDILNQVYYEKIEEKPINKGNKEEYEKEKEAYDDRQWDILFKILKENGIR